MENISFTRMMEKLIEIPEAIDAEIKTGLTKCVVQVHKTAVEKFGEYQPQVGPYEPWALLTLETLHRKLDLGGASGPDPLIGHYEKGNSVYPVPLRQSLSMKVEHLNGYVGTNDPIGEWQEFGTPKGIPPRPFLRPALYQNEEWIKKTMEEALGIGMVGIFR